LIVNGWAYDLETLLGNIQLETGTGGVDTPADNRLEGLEEITQQSKGHSVTLETTLSTQSDEAIQRRGSPEAVEGKGQNNVTQYATQYTRQHVKAHGAWRDREYGGKQTKRRNALSAVLQGHWLKFRPSWLTKTGKPSDRRRRGSRESSGST
jgi:hypothetical protein